MDGSVPGAAPAATAIQSTPPAPARPLPGPPPAPRPPDVLPLPRPATASLMIQACPGQAQLALAGLLGLTLLLLAVHSYGLLAFSTRPVEMEAGQPLTYRLDLNHAGKGELLQLPGVGPKMADRILDYRARHGPFASVADLSRVSGIGPATLRRLEGWVCVEGEDEDEPPSTAPRPKDKARVIAKDSARAKTPAGKPSPKANRRGPKINVNTATADELRKLPRIGPVLAQRIIDERGRKAFASIEELRRVKGIGPKTLENLRPLVTVGGQ